MALFASTDDLGDYLGETLSGARLAQAVISIELASARIQGWTRQRLERVVDDVVVLEGSSDWALQLPERPVISVSSVEVDGTVLAPTTWRVSGDLLVRRTGGWAGPVDSLVEVTYTHGYDPIPDDIRAVTLAIAAQISANPLGVRQEGIGSYNVSYGEDGVGQVDDLFAPLTRYRIRAASLPVRRPGRTAYPLVES